MGVAAFACPCVSPERIHKTAEDKLPSVSEGNCTDTENLPGYG